MDLLSNSLTLSSSPRIVGFTNNIGQMNCFLNSALQTLWISQNLRDGILQKPFQQYRMKLSKGIYQVIFQYKSKIPNWKKQTIDITDLRINLADIYRPNQFEINEMADTMEAIGALLRAIHAQWIQDQTEGRNSDYSYIKCQNCPAHSAFGLPIIEYLECQCGLSQQKQQDNCTFFCHYYVRDLLQEAAQINSEGLLDNQDTYDMNSQTSSLLFTLNRLGEYIQKQWAQTVIECCVNPECIIKQSSLTLKLKKAPQIFIVHLIWEKQFSDPLEIAQVLASIPFTMDLGKVYDYPSTTRHVLKGMIIFGFSHYFIVLKQKQKWYILNDDKSIVYGEGKWQNIFKFLVSNYFQPVGIIYEKASSAQRVQKNVSLFRYLQKFALDKSHYYQNESQLRKTVNQYNSLISFYQNSISQTWICQNKHLNSGEDTYCQKCQASKNQNCLWKCPICSAFLKIQDLKCEFCYHYRYTQGQYTRHEIQCSYCQKNFYSNSRSCSYCNQVDLSLKVCFNCQGYTKNPICQDCNTKIQCKLCGVLLEPASTKHCPKCISQILMNYCQNCEYLIQDNKPICERCLKQFWNYCKCQKEGISQNCRQNRLFQEGKFQYFQYKKRSGEGLQRNLNNHQESFIVRQASSLRYYKYTWECSFCGNKNNGDSYQCAKCKGIAYDDIY